MNGHHFFHKLIVPALFVILIVSIFTYESYDVSKLLEELNDEYPNPTLVEELDGTVTGIMSSPDRRVRDHPHQSFVVLDDSVKKSIRCTYSIGSGLTFDEVLKVGMKLKKKSGSDTLRVLEHGDGDSLRFVFRITDEQGYELRK